MVAKSKCYSCGKVSSGMPTAKIKGEERTYCADCYWKIDKEYKQKKTCDECAYFDDEKCKKMKIQLPPVVVGFNTYFVQAENCNHFSTDKQTILDEAKKLEGKGQFEEAARQYEKIEMPDKAQEARKKIIASPIDVSTSVKNLAKKGQTLTYYCCHCGTPLKIGAKASKIQKVCPNCNGDLEVIDLGKLINQHAEN